MSKIIYAIATMDSKGSELAYLVDCLRCLGAEVQTVDVGTGDVADVEPDISRATVLAGSTLPSDPDRGPAIRAMGQALRTWLLKQAETHAVAGVIGIGGSGGTALITAAMRELPIGLPKLMVSTMASGNTAPYVDCSDITMMYSVVDVAGLNNVSRRILKNAAGAMYGMAKFWEASVEGKPTLGMTMFGVTTPCVTAVRQALEAEGFDCLVFHATGSGGRAMEKLVDSGMITGVLDITTTEVADEIVGGVMPAGPKRFDILIEKQLPLIFSLGALDMVNFGPLESVPEKFRSRQLLSHNEQVTLMRTTKEENRDCAAWIAEKLNRSQSPLRVLIPEGGISALDAPGQPFYDPEADQTLFEELESRLHTNAQRKIIRLPCHINDGAFATALVENYLELQQQMTNKR